MKKLATMTAAAALMLGFAMSMGTSGALAGGSSDSSGMGTHCYLFFTGYGLAEGEFAQAMINDEDPDEVIKKIEEFLAKWASQEFALTGDHGNVGSGDFCRE